MNLLHNLHVKLRLIQMEKGLGAEHFKIFMHPNDIDAIYTELSAIRTFGVSYVEAYGHTLHPDRNVVPGTSYFKLRGADETKTL